MRNAITFFVVLFSLIALPMMGQNFTNTHFQNGVEDFPENLDQLSAKGSFVPDQAIKGKVYRWIQFYEIPNEQDLAGLQQKGISLLDYVPYNTYLASLPVALNLKQLKTFGVRSIMEVQAKEKMGPQLFESNFPSHAVRGDLLSVSLLIMPGAGINSTVAKLKGIGAEIKQVAPDYDIVEVDVPLAKIYDLTNWHDIRYIEIVQAPGEPEDIRGKSLHRSSAISGNYPGARNYDGSGVNMQVRDDGGLGPHVDFKGRENQTYVTNFGPTTGGTQHADMVSGSAGGAGNIDPEVQGSATGAFIYNTFYQANFLDITLALYDEENVVITNSSFSNGCNAGYTNVSRTVDIQLYNNEDYLHVFSAGNSGDINCGYGAGNVWGNITGGHKVAKNALVVGAANSSGSLVGFSSRGPTEDGRLKPDIVGHGADVNTTYPENGYINTQGTSFSAPAVAGVAAQLYQAYKELNTGENPDAVLIKGAIMNGAEDAGNVGPDYRYGFGIVNALRSVEILEGQQYLSSSVNNGQKRNHVINIPNGVKEARFMVIWGDPPAQPSAAIILTNDLDMKVKNGGITYQPLVLDPTPNATNLNSPAVPGRDSLNNVEQVVLTNPSAGSFEVEISGFSVPDGPQKYYLIYTFIEDEITLTYPRGGERFVPAGQERIRWDAYGKDPSDGTFTLEYSTDLGNSWTTISSTIASSAREYPWNVPNVMTAQALIRISRNALADTSEAQFNIMRVPPNLSIQQVCPDYTRVDWDPVAGASGYVVYLLGDKYMDSIGTTTNLQTFFDIQVDASAEEWIAVSAISPDGGVSRRSVAIERPSGLLNCVVGLDLRPEELLSPDFNYLPGCDPTQIPLVAVIKNDGLAPVFDLPIFYQVNSGPVYSDTITGQFPAGGQLVRTFADLIDFNSPGVYEIKVWTAQIGDQFPGNDTLRKRVEVLPNTVASIPFIEDFESNAACATTPNCGATVCPLNNGWTNLDNTFGDESDWRIHSSSTETSQTGPSIDHKPGNSLGKYAYIESSGGCQGSTALLWTPCIDLSNASQPEMTFWTHQFGSTAGSLIIDIYSNGGWLNSITQFVGNQGDIWRERTINLSSYAGKQIVIQFRGQVGNGFQSDIAIDDIQIYDRMGPPLVDFSADRREVCLNSPINFTDLTDNLPTSWDWSFEPSNVSYLNGTNSTSNNPVVSFPNYGLYQVSLKAANGNGTDSLIRTSYISVVEGTTPDWAEDFESGTFPPQSWQVENPDGLVGWQASSVIGIDGNTTTAAFMDNRQYDTNAEQDYLNSFVVDLSTASMPELSFDRAYVGRGVNRVDQLNIEISTDCGETYTQNLYSASGATLATALDDFDQWFPTSAADWQSDTIDLTPYVGNQVRIRFVNINGFGNSLFLDNIQLRELGASAPNAGLNYLPEVACEGGSVMFEDNSSGDNLSSYSWDFGSDATPSSATGVGPHMVTYQTAGSKTVKLTVSDGTVSDSVIYALTVTPLPQADFNFSTVGVTGFFSNNSTNGNSYFWDFGDGNSSTEQNPAHNYASNDNYTITLITTNDCGSDTLVREVTMSTVSVEDELDVRPVELYPNPTNGLFTVKLNSLSNSRVALKIIDLNGKVLQSTVVDGKSVQELDISNLATGLYILQVETSGTTQYLKVLKE
ncbi:MAG: S8 family serine peptidase [Bacteroidota bacterium]